MKARIRKTGEVVEIISYSGNTDRNDVLDRVSYIDSNGVEHPREKLNFYWDFETITDDKEYNFPNTDWNQVRVQASIGALGRTNCCTYKEIALAPFKVGDKVIVKGYEKMGEDEVICVFKTYNGDIKYKTKNHLDTHYFMEDRLTRVEKSNKKENMKEITYLASQIVKEESSAINPILPQDNMLVNKGWQCPICGRVYSPTTPMCFYCSNKVIANQQTSK